LVDDTVQGGAGNDIACTLAVGDNLAMAKRAAILTRQTVAPAVIRFWVAMAGQPDRFGGDRSVMAGQAATLLARWWADDLLNG